MAKKFITDKIFNTAAEAQAYMSSTFANLVEHNVIDPWSILHDQLPQTPITDEAGNPELDEAGNPVMASILAETEEGGAYIEPHDDLGTIAFVTIWDTDNPIAQTTGEPLARPLAFYCLNLPSAADFAANKKLAPMLAAIVESKMLAAARKIAKANHTDGAAHSLTPDRIATALAAHTTRTSRDNSFKIVFPFVAARFFKQIVSMAHAMKIAGKHREARVLLATYSKARFNSADVKACFESQAQAERTFPALSAAQWVNLINLAKQMAPHAVIRKLRKDETGKTIKDADGKAQYDTIPAPQPLVWFDMVLQTRDSVETIDDTTTIDLSGLVDAFTAEEGKAD